jgi:hypothetical protein
MLGSFKEQAMEFSFNTELEDAPVTVHWEYEEDEDGVYNSYVKKVIFSGIDVLPILPEETLYELDAKAIVVYEQLHD